MLTQVLEVINGISPEVQMAWGVFLLWALVLTVWFHRARAVVPVLAPPPKPRPARSTSSVVKMPARSTFRTGGSPELLAALGLAEQAAAPVSTTESPYR